ncbi:MAG: hypothetical protein JW956_15290 [Calditrichaceae bacterium]|nr:hypothetical protein [Calditrichaceae bacterium]
MMKATVFFLSIAFFIMCWSCGGDSKNESSAEKPKTEKKKKLSLKTEEGMMAKLTELDINVPAELKFVEVSRKSGEYTAKFAANDVDEATKTKLQEWYTKLVTDKAASGWIKHDIRVNEKMVGILINQHILLKPGEDGVDISTAYDSEDKTFTLYVNP